MFFVKSDEPTFMQTRLWDKCDDIKWQNLFKKSNKFRKEERKEKLCGYVFQNLTAPGLKPSKQVELYAKWQTFVPEEFQDIICPKPAQEILDNIQKERNKKQQKSAAARKPRAAKQQAQQQNYEESKSGSDVEMEMV